MAADRGKAKAEGERLLAQRQQARALAHETQAANVLLRALLDAMPVGVVVCDAGGAILMTNSPAQEILGSGIRGDILHPQRDYTAHYPDGSPLPPQEMPLVRALEHGNIVQGVEILIRRDDGSERTILAGAAPVRDQAGQIVSGVVVFQDITERKRLLAENRARREFLARLIDMAPVGIAVVRGPDHRYELVNPSYQAIPGVPDAPMVGRTIADVFPGVAAQGALELVERVYRTGETVSICEYEACVGPGRRETYWNVDYVPLSGPNGDVDGILILASEVTNQVLHRKQLQELAGLLARESQVLEIIMENTYAHLAYLDSEFNFVRVNSAYAHGSGYSKKELIGRNHFELFPHEENQAIFERVRETGRPATFAAKPFDFPDRPELGTTYWDWALVPVADKGGGSHGFVLSLVDVTEREKTRQALRRHAERLQVLHEIDQLILTARSVEEIAESAVNSIPRLVDCARASVVLFDQEAKEMRVIAACSEVETEVGGGWCGPLGDADFGELSRAGMAEELRQGQVLEVADIRALPASSPLMDALRAEGVRAIVSLPLVIQEDLAGSLNLGLDRPGRLTVEELDAVRELATVVAIGVYQTRLNEQVRHQADRLEGMVKKRTRALRSSQARFRAIFQEAGVGIALANSKGRVLDSNRALQRMLGYSDEGLRGRMFTEFLYHPDGDRDGDAKADGAPLWEELVAGQRDSYSRERRCVHKEGRLLWTNVVTSAIRNQKSRVRHLVIMVEDITERKRAQEALIHTEKLAIAGRLAASLTHEINNPLQSVIGSLDLAEESLAEDGVEEARELLQIGMEELERAAGVVTQLRDLNRPSDITQTEPTDVNVLVERVLALTRRQRQKHQVEVIWNAVDDLNSLMVVPDRIQQVFLNLVLNAVEAMPEGGRLEVSTSLTEEPAGVCISFADSGYGIAADALPHLFDPFYTTKAEGLGLGLYITKNIVEEHGGYIDVESQVGEGTTFKVWLPV